MESGLFMQLLALGVAGMASIIMWDIKDEIRKLRSSVEQLNLKMVTVVEKVTSHEGRITILEERKKA